MGSDRARETYNEHRQYRRVVQQQGRVVLEADSNEAQMILTEEMRREALDVIGPYGVPRDPVSGDRGSGYRIHTLHPHTRDFRVGVGSLYAGGWNVRQQDVTLRYGHQPDWLDGPDPPLPDVKATEPRQEIIYLRLREQEVSAVEDPVLLDTAMGGRDTSQRVRLVRRVGRATVPGHEGTSGRPLRHHDVFRQIDWGNPGIVLLPDQTTLGRTTLMTVSFDPVNKAYIGSDNQMIRVQGVNPATSGPEVATQLVWAFDNASALYPATIPDPDNPASVKLLTVPVDVWHQPKPGQFAEILAAAVDLANGAYVAAPSGTAVEIVQAYDPATRTIRLQAALPDSFTASPQLFVRIWESAIDVTAAFGRAVSLIDASGNATGLQVELADETNQTACITPGDYWSFTVRAAVPTSILPARYTRPQPPDGPREWVCPLALIDWARESIIDCRPSFANLTALSNTIGCCTLTLGVQDLKEKPLREWIENLQPAGEAITVCLRPGRYELHEPIHLGEDHSRVTIEACGGLVELTAAEHAHHRFENGLVQLHETRGLTLRGLRLVLPEADFGELIAEEISRFDPASAAARHVIFRLLGSMHVSIGLHLAGCRDVSIEHCSFALRRGHEHHHRRPVYGGCIVGSGDMRGLRVENCTFEANDRPREEEPHLLFGYLQAPPAAEARILLAEAAADRHAVIFTHAEYEGYSTSLHEARFHHNTFAGLTAAALVLGHAGRISISANRVRDCYGGFWLFARNGNAFEPRGFKEYEEIIVPVLADPHVYWALALARCLHRPPLSPDPDFRHTSFGLQVHDNTIDVASAALIGWHTGIHDEASAMINANRLTSMMQPIPTGVLMTVRYATLTANVLINHAEAERVTAVAFVVSHGTIPCRLAASGNVHKGLLLLPREGGSHEAAEEAAEPPDTQPDIQPDTPPGTPSGAPRDRRIQPPPRNRT